MLPQVDQHLADVLQISFGGNDTSVLVNRFYFFSILSGSFQVKSFNFILLR